MARKVDFDIWIGNSPTVSFRLRDPVTGLDQDLTGYVFVMRAVADGVQKYRKQVAPVGGVVSFPWTAGETRDLPVGKLTSYEIEARLNGSEITWIYGKITGCGGINDDIA